MWRVQNNHVAWSKTVLYYVAAVAYVYNGKLVSLIGNRRVGIFRPKSKILFHLSLALKWYQNFQDRATPVGGVTWPILKKRISFPHRESASWNFPAEIKNSLLPENIFHLIWKNPGLTFSARRRNVAKICRMLTCSSERKYKNKNKNETNICVPAYSNSVEQNNRNFESCWSYSSATVTWLLRDRRPTVEKFKFWAKMANFNKIRWTVTW